MTSAQPDDQQPASLTTPDGKHAQEVAREAGRRRTFAVISHPDAGKSTLTEALALHAQVINEAGAVHGKSGRRSTVSDWMEMEKARGISITSAALQFAYGDHVVNLVDTPGHSDFSEDTYRVLSAVDAAVMLIDAAKGLEPQTLKLFRVCKARGLPVITVINKWDRPGLDALALMEEIENDIGLQPTPLTWPVGIAGDFRGVLERRSGTYVAYTRTSGGATRAPEERMGAEAAAAREGEAWDAAVEESDLLASDGSDHDQELFLSGFTTPVLFASAISNFGVAAILETLVELAPAAAAVPLRQGGRRGAPGRGARGVGAVQRVRLQGAGRDEHQPPRHRRLRPGLLGRLRARHGRHPRADRVARSRPSTRRRSSARSARCSTSPTPATSSAWSTPTRCGSGDTIYLEEPVEFPPIPSFSPEHFAVATSADAGRFKQFRKGMEQLDHEGTVQVLRSELRGNQAPVLAAVGPMQFEVAQARMESEFGAPIRLETLGYTLARRTDAASAPELNSVRGLEVLERTDGTLLVLAPDKWRISVVERDHPELTLEPLVAGEK